MKPAYFKSAVGLQPFPTDPRELNAFVRWAARGHIMGQVAAAHEGEASGKLKDILENARIRSAHDRRMLEFEAGRIRRALLGSGIDPIILKGSAYVAKGLRAGRGRRVSDIDILVPEVYINKVEELLTVAGWQAELTTASNYDQQYYRKWMHELPPMRHGRRRTLIDVHHRLLPRTARLQPDHLAMADAAEPLKDMGVKAFAPRDLFIHAAIHIFADGALETPARSLIELYYLFDDLGADERRSLVHRAAEVGAIKPVRAALWAVNRYFDDTHAKVALRSIGPWRMGFVLRTCVKTLVAENGFVPIAKLALYIRSHYMRMPLGLLLTHLFKKATRRN